MATRKDIMMNIGGNIAGKVIETFLPTVIPAGQIVPGIDNGTLANLGVATAIDVIALTKPGMLRGMTLPAVSAANFIIADVVGDILLGMVAPAPVAAAVNAVATAGVRTNGSLIYID